MLRLMMLKMAKPPEGQEWPYKREIKIPVKAKTVMQPGATQTGFGTQGLGKERCTEVASERNSLAIREWEEYKASMPPPPSASHVSSGKSPRDRYYIAQQEHRQALAEFEASRQQLFSKLQQEKKMLSQQLDATKALTSASQFDAIQKERQERIQRLEEFQKEKAEFARSEKQLADQISAIWRHAGEEAHHSWQAWVKQRKAQQASEVQDFRELQVQRRKELCDAATQARHHKRMIAEQRAEQKALEEKKLHEEVQAFRRRSEENHARALQVHEAQTYASATKFRKEEEQWLQKKRKSDELRSNVIRERSTLLKYSCDRQAQNSLEECLLRKKWEADETRRWKKERSAQGSASEQQHYHVEVD